jgi:hypothetical protein
VKSSGTEPALITICGIGPISAHEVEEGQPHWRGCGATIVELHCDERASFSPRGRAGEGVTRSVTDEGSVGIEGTQM